MSDTKQPIWKLAGKLGDVDPIAYGGGFIYTDETGVYPPEVTWFEPAPDDLWHQLEGKTPVQVYRFILEPKPEQEWWYEKLGEIVNYTSQPLEMLQADARGTLKNQAQLYADLISYFGAEEFDSYPLTMTEDEAYAKYAQEMKVTA